MSNKIRKKSALFNTESWKILFEYLKTYRETVMTLSVLGIISAVGNGSVPYLTGRFLDAILEPNIVFSGTNSEMPSWLLLLILYATVQIVLNVTDWIIDRKRRWLGTTLNATYVARAIGDLLVLPMSFHKGQKTGEVWDRIMRAQSGITNIIENIIISLTPQLLSVAVGIVFLLIISPMLASIIFVGIALYVLTLIRIVPPIVKLQRTGNRRWNQAFGDAYDALANVQAVKQFTAEGPERRKLFRQFVVRAAGSWYTLEKIWSGIHFYQRIIVAGTQITIFALSVFLIQKGTLTVGELIALNGYAMLVFGPFVSLGSSWQSLQSGLVGIERAEKLLRLRPENVEPGRRKLSDVAGRIEFKDVTFGYSRKSGEVLRGISFVVEPGEVVAFVGESGVGKSTTIDLISGYYRPTSGKVLIDGHDTRSVDLHSLRKHIAVVPQEPILFNDTVKANIRYGKIKVTDEEVVEAARRAHASEFIEEKFPKKYEQVVGERGVRLSVGQKQRIAIARAILRDPSILILDEPTSALDARTERFITESLEELMRGRTTFIIAHRLSTVRRADKILVFDRGQIVEMGRHQELMQIENGIYRGLYEHQAGTHHAKDPDETILR